MRYVVKCVKADDVEADDVEADDGHVGEDPVTTKVTGSMVHPQKDAMLLTRTKVRRRHETANKRLMQFKVLSTTFWHSILIHGKCFRSVAVLIHLEIQNRKPLFDVSEYKDPLYCFIHIQSSKRKELKDCHSLEHVIVFVCLP